MVIEFEPASLRAADAVPAHVNPVLWQQSLGLARQISARVFRDGVTANDAVVALGLKADSKISWDKAVELIAGELSRNRATVAKAGHKAA